MQHDIDRKAGWHIPQWQVHLKLIRHQGNTHSVNDLAAEADWFDMSPGIAHTPVRHMVACHSGSCDRGPSSPGEEVQHLPTEGIGAATVCSAGDLAEVGHSDYDHDGEHTIDGAQ